jgi:hypothetical protein
MIAAKAPAYVELPTLSLAQQKEEGKQLTSKDGINSEEIGADWSNYHGERET